MIKGAISYGFLFSQIAFIGARYEFSRDENSDCEGRCILKLKLRNYKQQTFSISFHAEFRFVWAKKSSFTVLVAFSSINWYNAMNFSSFRPCFSFDIRNINHKGIIIQQDNLNKTQWFLLHLELYAPLWALTKWRKMNNVLKLENLVADISFFIRFYHSYVHGILPGYHLCKCK